MPAGVGQSIVNSREGFEEFQMSSLVEKPASGRVDVPPRRENIADVVRDRLCTACGTCAAVCPTGAISMDLDERRGTFKPTVKPSQCTECGLCRTCCPPITWSNGQTSDLWDPHVGDYVRAFAGYATDEQLRHDAASGGFITALLLHLLRKGLITGAVVTRRRDDEPLLGEPFLAATEEDIIAAKGSKYMPVPFDGILKGLLRWDLKGQRIAYVGLPCHLEGLFRASERFSVLREAVRYKIGIVCGRTPSLLAYDYILRRLHIPKSQVAQIRNRGDGWPGYMTISLKDGSNRRIHHTDYLAWGTVFSSPVFTPTGCELCVDPGGFCADVMVSDAWLPRFRDDHKGVNAILVKSQEMLDIVSSMKQEGSVELLDSSVDEFVQANRSVMTQKLLNTQVALPLLAGRSAAKYARNMTYVKRPTLGRRLKLFLFYMHVHVIMRLNLAKTMRFLNGPVMFYLKAIKLLKK